MKREVYLRLSGLMFLQFFVWGCWYVTVGNYMGRIGMADAVYWAYTVGPIGAIISPFFLGMVADRFFSLERVLGADKTALPLQISGFAGIVTAIYSFTLPHTPPTRRKNVSVREILGIDALEQLKSRSFLVVVVSSFLMCIPLSA